MAIYYNHDTIVIPVSVSAWGFITICWPAKSGSICFKEVSEMKTKNECIDDKRISELVHIASGREGRK